MRFKKTRTGPFVVQDGEYPFLDPESEDGQRINRHIKIAEAINRNMTPMKIERVEK